MTLSTRPPINPPDSPPRLKDGAPLGSLIRQLQHQTLSAERMAHSADVIKAKVALLGATSLTLATVIKIALPLLLVGGATSYYVVHKTRMQRPAVELPVHAPTRVAVESIVKTERAAANNAQDYVAFSKAPQKPFVRKRRGVSAVPRTLNISAPVELSDEPMDNSSTLGIQVQQFEAAQDLARRENFIEAISHLDALMATYPNSPLAAEIRLNRADYLVRSRRYDEARIAITALLSDPQHRGRYEELRRVLNSLPPKKL